VDEFDQILLVTDQGQLIRTPVTQVRMVGRNTSGVIVFRTAENEHVVSVERLADTGEDEAEDIETSQDDGGTGGEADGPEAPEA
jgi:DNA gyrase subunit A